MPIIKSAKKALRVSKRKKVLNTARKEAMRGAVKKLEKMVAQKKTEEAKKALPAAYQAIDKALKRGVIKRNNAARKKARLSALVNRA
jgi:small subunit ribosomal protein S20